MRRIKFVLLIGIILAYSMHASSARTTCESGYIEQEVPVTVCEPSTSSVNGLDCSQCCAVNAQDECVFTSPTTQDCDACEDREGVTCNYNTGSSKLCIKLVDAKCGNGICEYDETPNDCEKDCTPCNRDTICSITENDQTCPSDCNKGLCNADLTCDSYENYYICNQKGTDVCKCKGDYCSLPYAFAECPGQCLDSMSVEESNVITQFIDDDGIIVNSAKFVWAGERFTYENNPILETYTLLMPLSDYAGWVVLSSKLSVFISRFIDEYKFELSIGPTGQAETYNFTLCNGGTSNSCCGDGERVYGTRKADSQIVACESFLSGKGAEVSLDFKDAITSGRDNNVQFEPADSRDLSLNDHIIIKDLKIGIGIQQASENKYLQLPIRWAFGIKGAEIIGDKNSCSATETEDPACSGVTCDCTHYIGTILPQPVCDRLRTPKPIETKTLSLDITPYGPASADILNLDYASNMARVFTCEPSPSNNPDNNFDCSGCCIDSGNGCELDTSDQGCDSYCTALEGVTCGYKMQETQEDYSWYVTSLSINAYKHPFDYPILAYTPNYFGNNNNNMLDITNGEQILRKIMSQDSDKLCFGEGC